MEKNTQPFFPFAELLKFISAAFKSLFESPSKRNFQRWKDFIAS
jgi:hypothetical protein